MEPLANRSRPNDFKFVVGQDHLVGENGPIRRFIETGRIFSFILYGKPGTGKTTIANITALKSNLEYFSFNASTDNKAFLKEIANRTMYNNVLLIIDEIHRMKADTQDFLLPFIEKGTITIIGITTENPYRAVNEAIRSRCQIYEVLPLEPESIKQGLLNIYNSSDFSYDGKINHDVFTYISNVSAGDLRVAINMLEIIVTFASKEDVITLNIAKMALGGMKSPLDYDYYDILSAFQKSIRGSDVDASLHYLARLLATDNLESIIRRLLVIVYEDVGLANPGLGPKVVAACEAAVKIGLPEAKYPLAVAVIDTALSPKSNTAGTAINKALEKYINEPTGEIPKHILNREIAKNPNIYKYPHDYKNSYVIQQYLPDKIIDDVYYTPKDESKYEQALKQRLLALKTAKKVD
ncbi:MAG TPA: AAA family ATPase [Acholeplasma sp.]|nr:AAA family ATPase [Acholeplasma sp.]